MSFDVLSSFSHDKQGTLNEGAGSHGAQCSRRGCQANAAWRLEWNNPKIHDPDRRKVWTACHEHRQYLVDFLSMRGFLKEVRAL